MGLIKHIATIFHELGSSGFEWWDAIYRTGAMLIQELCPDTWLASRYSHIITISHTLSFRKLSTLSSLCSIWVGISSIWLNKSIINIWNVINLLSVYMRTHSSKLDNGDYFFIMEKTSFICSLCQNKFATKFNLMRQIKSHHAITEDIGENV